MGRLTQADLIDRNHVFEQRSPQELLQWAYDVFGTRVAAISAMQRSGSVICHMIHSLKLPIRVLFVDTGVMFPETLETRDRIAREYGLEIVTLRPEKTMEEQTRERGVLYLTPDGQQECCRLRKVEPLRKVSDQFDALIGSLRRADGGRRAECPILAVDPDNNALRVNPLANFSDAQLEDYIERHNVIVNPLHFQGYATIGCNRCTTPVLPHEPKRAGRWRHLGQWAQYCGINPTDADPAHQPSIELPDELIDRILGRESDFVI
ncbi:MAG: phosphoadenylyl-sulfate reductase [Planctomycetota bacterium]|nr:MAG: phosphoadenylyl-sulfate reductase [Planctomycetota bacterium]